MSKYWEMLTEEEQSILHHAEDAVHEVRRGVDHWLKIGHAVQVFQDLVLRHSRANKPAGPIYNKAFRELLADEELHQRLPLLAELAVKGKSQRSTAHWLWKNQSDVMPWLESQPRLRWQHPHHVQAEYRRTHDKQGKPLATPKPKPATITKQLREAEAELAKLRDKNAVVIRVKGGALRDKPAEIADRVADMDVPSNYLKEIAEAFAVAAKRRELSERSEEEARAKRKQAKESTALTLAAPIEAN